MSQEQSARDKQDQTTASPWAALLRRRLQRSSLAASRTRALVTRMQQTSRRTVVWRPSLGSLRPALVQRFASAVSARVQRAQPASLRRRGRREAARTTGDWSGELDMTLPSAPEAEPPAPSQPPPPGTFTVGQRIEPLRSKPPSEPGIQRSPSTPPAPKRTASKPPQRQPRTLPPRSRLYARVEEVKRTTASPPPSQPPSPAGEPGPAKGGEEEPRAPAAPASGLPPAVEERAVPQSDRPAVQRRIEGAPLARGKEKDRSASQPAGKKAARGTQPPSEPEPRPEPREEPGPPAPVEPADTASQPVGTGEATPEAADAQRATVPSLPEDADEDLPLAAGPAARAPAQAETAQTPVDEPPREQARPKPGPGRVQRATEPTPEPGREQPGAELTPQLGREQRAPVSKPDRASRALPTSPRREPTRSGEEPALREPGPVPASEEEPAPPSKRDAPETVQRQAARKPQAEPRTETAEPHEVQTKPGDVGSPEARHEAQQAPTEGAKAGRPLAEPESGTGRTTPAPLPPVEKGGKVEMPLPAGPPAGPAQAVEPGVPAPPEPAPEAASGQRAPEPRRRSVQRQTDGAVEPERPAPAPGREASERERPLEPPRMPKSAAKPPDGPGESRSEERQDPGRTARPRRTDDAPLTETAAQQPARIQRQADRDRETPGRDEQPDKTPLPQAKPRPPGTEPATGQASLPGLSRERDLPLVQDRPGPTARVDRRAEEPRPSGARRATAELPVGDQGPSRPQAADQEERAVDEAAPGLEQVLQVRAHERAQVSLLRSAQWVTSAPVRIARQPVPRIARLAHRKRREATPQTTEPAAEPVPTMDTRILGGQEQSATAASPGAMVLPALGRPAPARATSRAAAQPVQRMAAAAAPAVAPRSRAEEARAEEADEDRLPLAKPPVARSQEEAKAEEPEAAAPQTVAAPAGTVTATPPAVQRAVDDEAGAEWELDLGQLAERVYPFIKRMLQIERERRPYA